MEILNKTELLSISGGYLPTIIPTYTLVSRFIKWLTGLFN